MFENNNLKKIVFLVEEQRTIMTRSKTPYK